MSKQVINLEKSENYQNDILDRLQKEKTRLEILNVEYSEKLQKAEIDLMTRTKERENFRGKVEKAKRVIEELRNSGVEHLNKIDELEGRLAEQVKDWMSRKKDFEQEKQELSETIRSLNRKVENYRKLRVRVGQLLKVPSRIRGKLQRLHLHGIKMKK